jgi:hypothetical protein
MTIPLILDDRCDRLLVNADASGGELRVQVREAEGDGRIDGLGYNECRAVTGDGLRTEVLWGDAEITRQKLAALRGKAVCLEFSLRKASLYAFEFTDGAAP